MTKKQITKEFLRLFSKDWDDPTAHRGFRELRKQVEKQGQWPAIVDARLMTLKKKTDEAVKLLKETITRDPGNFCTSLLLARILSNDSDQPEEAISVYDFLLQQRVDR
ncbi:MAG: tetratricopeptide repeat protein [Desulfomonilaceae bacterium]